MADHLVISLPISSLDTSVFRGHMLPTSYVMSHTPSNNRPSQPVVLDVKSQSMRDDFRQNFSIISVLNVSDNATFYQVYVFG